MRIRLRQVALVARDLALVEHAIEAELDVELCFRDPGVGHFGLRNALYPIGDKLLEVVSPIEEGTTAGRLLDRRGGDGGYMVLFQVDDLAGMRERLEEAALRIVFQAEAAGITGLHLHPRDIGGAIVSVDQTDDWDEWPWAGPDWRRHVRRDTITDIVAVEVSADDPVAMASRWAAVLGGRLDGATVHFEEGAVRFVPAGRRGEGVSGIDFAGTEPDRRQLEIAGTAIQVLPAG